MKLSVVLPIYNAEKYLGACIDSLLSQTWKDFEILAINDGSTDNSEKILLSYNDDRIKIVNNEKNIGLIATLNKAIALCSSSDYIARMDADDICKPERFEKQIGYFKENPGIAVLGSDMTVIDDLGQIRFRHFIPVTQPDLMNWILLRRSMLFHPTVMFNMSVFTANELYYDPNDYLVEDYALWLRLSRNKKLVSLKDPLLFYRRHKQSVSSVGADLQKSQSRKVVLNHFKSTFGYLPSFEIITLLNSPSSIHLGHNLESLMSEVKKMRFFYPASILIDENLQGFYWQLLFFSLIKRVKGQKYIIRDLNVKYTGSLLFKGIRFLWRRLGISEKLKI